ncbi:MAG: metallophosphoesterase [Candidatus Aminicenantes bacterium]|nr:metallophosphoesterase [Candidatus Aminicenantes bacterium]
MPISRLWRRARRAVPLWLGLAFLLGSAFAAETPCQWTGIERVVAVADLHGDYERFVFILTHPEIGLVDRSLHWTGGKTHLVQLGDVLDRGPRAKAILDLIQRLEREAAEAGGMVHMLLGNHEEMNITGIALDYPDYVTPEQFVSFLPWDLRRERESQYLQSLPPEAKREAEAAGLDIFADAGLREFWRKTIAAKNPEVMRAYVMGFNDAYGDWLIRRNTVIKINDVVYAHGGINEALSKTPLREINQTMRDELAFFQGRMRDPQQYRKPFHPKLVYDPDSPLWFRGLAAKSEEEAAGEVDRILANLGAKAMVIGHNYFRYPGGRSPVVTRELVSRFQEKIWIMDTGISSMSYAGVPSAFIEENGAFRVWGETEEVAERSGIRPPPLRPLSPREMETLLRAAAVTGRGPGPGGRTDAWKLTLESADLVVPALFKYVDRPRPDPIPDSYRYDLAAYALNQYLGLECVPPIVARSVEDVPGAVQLFIDNAKTVEEFRSGPLAPRDPVAFERAMADLVVFQALVHDDCRNAKDTLVGKDGHLYRVDFSEAFDPTTRDAPGCDIRKCSRLLYRRLLAWEDETVAGYLGRYLGADEIKALNARSRIVVRKIRLLIRSLGESNVLL